MRYRIGSAPTARVLPTLDGPLAVKAGEVVVVAVVRNLHEATRVMLALQQAEDDRK